MKLLSATLAYLSFLSLALAEEAKPNIIFIFSDDWGWEDLSCHDHPYVKTPNIDRLAKEGADFTEPTGDVFSSLRNDPEALEQS